MVISFVAQERDVGGEVEIGIRDSLPNILEVVLGEPHVLTAAGDRVSMDVGLVRGRAWMEKRSDVLVAVEQTERECASVRG